MGALCPTGGPLTPLCPQAIHYHTTHRTDEGRVNEMANEEDEDKRVHEWVSGSMIETARDMWERDTRVRVEAQTERNMQTQSRIIFYVFRFLCTYTLSTHC